ncbi:hypothetical protein Fmac_017992 [Flemingia macrophylla]|uniref:Uncharacterized protein n=1 Tax=Flemingia macrophylla TaxID=520843 RepID=A0ABD1M3T1_9FABA
MTRISPTTATSSHAAPLALRHLCRIYLRTCRMVVMANLSNVEYILKTNFANFPKGKPFTEILNDLLACSIFNVDSDL